MNDDLGTEGVESGASARGVERVGIVIWDGSTSQAELRRFLGDALPLRFVRWQDRTYLSVIEQLRPCVIVAVEPDDELAADVAGLLGCLVTDYTPTIVGMTLPPRPAARRRSSSRGGASEGEEPEPSAGGIRPEAVVENELSIAGPRRPAESSARAQQRRLLVRQLGPCEGARIDSLADLLFC